VFAAQVDAGDEYTNAQFTECHEEMADDHVLPCTNRGRAKPTIKN
jgi:hypothetical protein